MNIEKITVYKIKDTISDFSGFIKTKDSKKNTLPALQNLTLPEIPDFNGTVIAKAAYKESGGTKKTADNIPWLAFINETKPDGEKFKFEWTNKFPSAIVAIKITVDGQSSFYALTFGMGGDSFLDHDVIVHDFGIKVAMNICDENELKRIQTSIHEAVSTQTERQISSSSNLSTFNINGEKEFLRMIVGTALSEYSYISSFKGKEGISLKIDKEDVLTWETLIPRLHQLGTVSANGRYKEIFPDYDKFPFENDPEKIDELNALLFEKIKEKKYDRIHLSPPEFFDYDTFLFMYDSAADSKKYDELILSDLLAHRKRDFRDDATISSIKGMKISIYNATSETVYKNKWSAYKCLVAEVDDSDDQSFILSMGQWRRISTDLMQEVSDHIDQITPANHTFLPENISIWNPQAKGGKNGKPYIGENQESVYNKNASDNSDTLFLFDKGKIEIAGEKKYEVCDLLHKDKRFIQVKRFSTGSASISHLFVQARFYAHAFLFDEKCRKSMREHVNTNANGANVASFIDFLPDDRAEINAGEYCVCICILTDRDNLQISDLPFMAKYELMHSQRYLTNLGLQHEVIVRKVVYGAAVEHPNEQDEAA